MLRGWAWLTLPAAQWPAPRSAETSARERRRRRAPGLNCTDVRAAAPGADAGEKAYEGRVHALSEAGEERSTPRVLGFSRCGPRLLERSSGLFCVGIQGAGLGKGGKQVLAEGSPAPRQLLYSFPSGGPRQTRRERGEGAASPSGLCGRSPLGWKTGGLEGGVGCYTEEEQEARSQRLHVSSLLLFFPLSHPPGWHPHRWEMPSSGPALQHPGPSREDAEPWGQGHWAILAEGRSVLGRFWGVHGVLRFC